MRVGVGEGESPPSPVIDALQRADPSVSTTTPVCSMILCLCWGIPRSLNITISKYVVWCYRFSAWLSEGEF